MPPFRACVPRAVPGRVCKHSLLGGRPHGQRLLLSRPHRVHGTGRCREEREEILVPRQDKRAWVIPQVSSWLAPRGGDEAHGRTRHRAPGLQ